MQHKQLVWCLSVLYEDDYNGFFHKAAIKISRPVLARLNTLLQLGLVFSHNCYGAFQWAGERRDYDFTSGEYRSSDVTIGDHRFEVVKIKTLPFFIPWFQSDGK